MADDKHEPEREIHIEERGLPSEDTDPYIAFSFKVLGRDNVDERITAFARRLPALAEKHGMEVESDPGQLIINYASAVTGLLNMLSPADQQRVKAMIVANEAMHNMADRTRGPGAN